MKLEIYTEYRQDLGQDFDYVYFNDTFCEVLQDQKGSLYFMFDGSAIHFEAE